jgi:hypothetical protein
MDRQVVTVKPRFGEDFLERTKANNSPKIFVSPVDEFGLPSPG